MVQFTENDQRPYHPPLYENYFDWTLSMLNTEVIRSFSLSLKKLANISDDQTTPPEASDVFESQRQAALIEIEKMMSVLKKVDQGNEVPNMFLRIKEISKISNTNL